MGRTREQFYCYTIFLCFNLLLLLLLLLLLKVKVAISHSMIRSLPGFPGFLPFELETGYVGVGESEEVQIFYYFMKSERNPKEDPVVLWLSGGPGCTSLSGLFYEIGPLQLEILEYNGSVPTLRLNPYSWSKVSNLIFIDSPVGTGFSYSTNFQEYCTGDFKASQQASQFLKKWLIDHTEFLSNSIYIGGDSYSGKTVPLVVQYISDGNQAGSQPFINLKGYLLGNPVTDQTLENYTKFAFAHGMGLISDEFYETLKKCGWEFEKCLDDINTFYELISGIRGQHILVPLCHSESLEPMEIVRYTRYLNDNSGELLDPLSQLPTFGCWDYRYLLVDYWANNNSVQQALNVRKGSIRKWQRCNDNLPYTFDVKSSIKYHANLSTRGYRSLVYSGDHDMNVTFLSTQTWIRSLNYSIVDDWRQWRVDGDVAGYTRTYSNKMTFATVKGGGHTAPEFKPKECFAMFKRWISQEPL